MSDLRVLTDAELDMVSGGGLSIIARPEPVRGCGPVKVVEELVVELLRALEPRRVVTAKAY
jgi:hypothetical protein